MGSTVSNDAPQLMDVLASSVSRIALVVTPATVGEIDVQQGGTLGRDPGTVTNANQFPKDLVPQSPDGICTCARYFGIRFVFSMGPAAWAVGVHKQMAGLAVLSTSQLHTPGSW